jgi:hypothetical protein
MKNPVMGWLCSSSHVCATLGKWVGPVLAVINRKSKESLMHDMFDQPEVNRYLAKK